MNTVSHVVERAPVKASRMTTLIAMMDATLPLRVWIAGVVNILFLLWNNWQLLADPGYEADRIYAITPACIALFALEQVHRRARAPAWHDRAYGIVNVILGLNLLLLAVAVLRVVHAGRTDFWWIWLALLTLGQLTFAGAARRAEAPVLKWNMRLCALCTFVWLCVRIYTLTRE